MEKVGINIEMLDGQHFIPLDEIIFIHVKRKTSSFFLRNSTPEANISLRELWEMIKKAGLGHKHLLKKVGRKHIINLAYYHKIDLDRNMVILKREPFTMLPSETVKSTKELPEEVLRHFNAIKALHSSPDSEKKQESIEVPLKFYEVEIGEEPLKKLQKYIEDERRFKVIENYASRQELTVPLGKLNKEHLMEVGYEYVDLDLSSGTLWAAQDLNERSYYAWGELYENDIYSEKTYIHKDNLNSIIDPRTGALSLNYDAAHHFRGGGWRIPTKEECEELLNECTLNWCISNERIHGCLLTGPNGKHLFLPANGYMQGERNMGYEKFCSYWSSSNGEFDRPEAIKICEYEGKELEIERWVTSNDPYRGLPIRPVISKGGLTGQEGGKKRMLILDDFFANEEDFVMQGFYPTMDGWDIRRITPPVDYDKAANMIDNTLKTFNPEVVVAFKNSCFWGQKIKGRIKFLVEPGWKISEAMRNYMEVEQEGKKKKDWPVTQDMIDFYESKEEKLPQNEQGEKCWILAEEPWEIDAPQFEKCNSVELLPPNDLLRWADTCLFPIIKEVTDRLDKGQTDEKTLYERKFNI